MAEDIGSGGDQLNRANAMVYQDDDFFQSVKKTVTCPVCRQEARSNMHLEQGEIVDYFYECRCGKIIELEEIEDA